MTELEGYIDEFIQLPKDTTAIAELLYLREQIAGHLYLLSSNVGIARKNFMTAKTLYEGKKLMKRVEYLDKGVGKADAISRANSLKEYGNMNDADGTYHLEKFNYDSAKEILSALSQKISWLKDEIKYTRVIGG